MKDAKKLGMNSLSKAVGIALGLSMPFMTANAEDAKAEFYGRLDLAIQNFEDESVVGGNGSSDDTWEVESYASRLGVKGSAELESGITGIYKYEVEIDPADTSSSSEDMFKARNQFVGVKMNAGTLLVGRKDTPLKESQGKVDIFGDHNADIKNYLPGENRLGSIINYESPKMMDSIVFKLTLAPGEEDASAGDDPDNGLADGVSSSISYHQGGTYLAFAMDQDIPSKNILGSTLDADLYRFTAQQKLGDFTLGALFQTGEPSTDTEVTIDDVVYNDVDHTGWMLSAAYKLNNTVFKLQGGNNTVESRLESGTADTTDEQLIALGVDFKISKQTKFYVEYIELSDDLDSNDTTTLGGGIQHKFSI